MAGMNYAVSKKLVDKIEHLFYSTNVEQMFRAVKNRRIQRGGENDQFRKTKSIRSGAGKDRA